MNTAVLVEERKLSFTDVLSARSKEVYALIKKTSNRKRQLSKATFGPVMNNLRNHHDFDKARSLANKELEKAWKREDKRYAKKRKAIYAKYEDALRCASVSYTNR